QYYTPAGHDTPMDVEKLPSLVNLNNGHNIVNNGQNIVNNGQNIVNDGQNVVNNGQNIGNNGLKPIVVMRDEKVP
ncbi:MAG: hypothetical protein U1B80_10220, partial [Anaerolineaceae bacterium]|nr:hypothetical protein [Anaerolineaceae bacterium]